ncbi:carboxymuconolactone decarboxylase family protein [Chondromyces apiculatus]|uniref:Alkylhydroperoxidase AhpD core n=1 Tax=Chondromyces apiculatus DSM 436 TaxID=1192034 RepID=A0A017T4H3_9BACT|nr:carboxymuconolactone decarboxylase family protein [Chondromyces apiculatus]EYF04114.1 Alkylhydroperoxidase AhpD core [Chondromyces apiculatus DSM 436]
MTTITVPAHDDVSQADQALLDNLKKAMGFVPNLYATMAHSETALGSYLAFQNTRRSLKPKERETVNLVVSQINHCRYCLSAHTMLARKYGLSDEEVLQVRRGHAPFDPRLDALAKLVKSVVVERGHTDPAALQAFFDAGFGQGHLVDVVMAIGVITVTNYLHSTTQVPIDFPLAPELDG